MYSCDVTSRETAVSGLVTSADDVISENDVTVDAVMTRFMFADDAINDARTEAERVTSLEDKHQMSLQSMKELLLSSVSTAPAYNVVPDSISIIFRKPVVGDVSIINMLNHLIFLCR